MRPRLSNTTPCLYTGLPINKYAVSDHKYAVFSVMKTDSWFVRSPIDGVLHDKQLFLRITFSGLQRERERYC